MSLSELINGLCEYLRIEPIPPDARGIYEIVFDEDLDLEVLSLGTSLILVRAQIGTLPDEETQQQPYLQDVLRNNLLNLKSEFNSVSLETSSGKLWLYRSTRIDQMDTREFSSLINAFVNTLEWWKSLDNNNSVDMPTSSLPFNMIRP
ncbi:hypothetical protein GC197_08845 [bacterium]|nr:hypothetical protein [bacterium]